MAKSQVEKKVEEKRTITSPLKTKDVAAPKQIQREEGVPIPPPVSGRPSLYRFMEMKVGESIFVECSPYHADIIRSAASQCKRRSNGEFDYTSRVYPDGVRIWRIDSGKKETKTEQKSQRRMKYANKTRKDS